jgi:rubredoxin
MSATVPSRYECGVCWLVYDPSEGDSVWQVPPGTAFEDLPHEWCCPNCDAPRDRFMRVADEG